MAAYSRSLVNCKQLAQSATARSIDKLAYNAVDISRCCCLQQQQQEELPGIASRRLNVQSYGSSRH